MPMIKGQLEWTEETLGSQEVEIMGIRQNSQDV